MLPRDYTAPPTDPHLKRWMMFVDGENLTLRAQQLVQDRGISLREGPYYSQDVFVWLPEFPARRALSGQAAGLSEAANETEDQRMGLRTHGIRSYYYTKASQATR